MPKKSDKTWKSKSALAGAAIGSAAIAAALLFASRRKEQGKSETVYLPPRPAHAPETD
ncbi:MAG: hypothetical protein P8J20_07535 [Novosphingobium sp.]|nr:hypothetical protein [Novosphingobium sp.]